MAFDLVVRGGLVITPMRAAAGDMGVRSGSRSPRSASPARSRPRVRACSTRPARSCPRRRGAAHAPGPPHHDPSRRARDVARPRGRHAGDGLSGAPRPTSTSATSGREPTSRAPSRSAPPAGAATPTSTTRFHVTLCGALPLGVFEQIGRGDSGRLPQLQGLHHQRLAAPSPANRKPDRRRPDRLAMEKVAAHGGLVAVHGEDEDLVQFNYEKHPGRGPRGRQPHMAADPQRALGGARLRADDRPGPGDRGRRLLRPHLAREGVEAVAAARAAGPARLRRDAAPVRLLQRRRLPDPRGFCAHTYPSLKLARATRRRSGAACVDAALSTLATDEYPTTLAEKLRGKDIDNVTGGNIGAEARMGIAYSEGVVKRGMCCRASPTSRRPTRPGSSASIPPRGPSRPGATPTSPHRPGGPRPLARDDFHVSDYSPWEGWPVSGWPVTTILRGRVIADHGRVLGSRRRPAGPPADRAGRPDAAYLLRISGGRGRPPRGPPGSGGEAAAGGRDTTVGSNPTRLARPWADGADDFAPSP